MARHAAVVAVAAAVLLVSGAAARSESASSPPRAVRTGGVNIIPGVRPWRYDGPNPDGWWCDRGKCRGAETGTVFIDKEAPLIARLHAKIVRVDFPWSFIEPARGFYDWRRADYIVRALRKYKLRIHAVLSYPPAWAAETQASPPDANDWTTFVQAFARRYRTKIAYFELWNEPDLKRYWTGTTEQFVKTVVIPGARAVKAAAPRRKVIVAPSYANTSWFEDLYRFGGGRSFDIISWHDYAANASILAHAKTVRSVLRAHGQGQKPIWLGEYGVEEPGTDDDSHAGLATLVLTGRGPIAVAEWYALRDDYPMTCCPPEIIERSTYGLLTADYEPKKSYRVMRSLLSPRHR